MTEVGTENQELNEKIVEFESIIVQLKNQMNAYLTENKQFHQWLRDIEKIKMQSEQERKVI